MTMPAPIPRASGSVRRGFFTSPAMKVTSCQESAAKSDPVCATQMAAKRPKALVAASGPGVREVVSHRGRIPAQPQTKDDQSDQRRRLGHGEYVLNDLAVLQ